MFKTTNYLLFKSLNQLNDINRSYMGKKVACLLLPTRRSRETMQIEAVMQRLVSTSFPGRQFNRRSTLAQLSSRVFVVVGNKCQLESNCLTSTLEHCHTDDSDGDELQRKQKQ